MSDDAAEAALMASFEAPADDLDGSDDEGAGDEDGDDNGAPEGDEDGTEGDDEDGDEDEDGDADPAADLPAAPPAAIKDETEVEVTIDGEVQKFTVGSLKRLAGQEASLTRKSQEADRVGATAAAGIQAALDVIQEDLAPYENVDWLVLQQQVDPETFAWHRENAARLASKREKLMGAFKGVEDSFSQRKQVVDQEAAKAALAELAADIPDWSEKTYADIIAFGAKEGLDADDLKAVTNPKVLKILRKAMLYDNGQQVATKKVKQTPARVLKPGNRTEPTDKAQKLKSAEKRLAANGSDQDAMAVLMGRWG